MKNLKKLIAIIMVIALMIPCTAMAATESPSKASLKGNTTIVLSKKSFTFNNKSQKPSVKTVTYKNADGKTVTLKEGTDYTVSFSKKSTKNAGTYKVTIKGTGKYSGSVTSSYTIKKAKQKNVKVTNKYKATKAKTFKKKGKSYTFKATGVKGKAKVTYTASSKKIKVKKGKITLSKGIKKGTYKIVIKAKATKNHKKGKKVVKITIK